MKALVIGGTLFMGREIVRRLVARGHDVSVMHRGERHDLGADVHNLQADRNDISKVAGHLARGRFEAIFDLAYDWQRGTTAEQVEGAARAGGDRLTRYVFMSSIAAYAPGLNHVESDPLAPDDSHNQYARNKAMTERRLFDLHAESGFPVSTFRPPFVHGPNQPFYREQFFWDRLIDGRAIILPEGGVSPISWVFARDVAEACVRAMEVPAAAGEAFNIAHLETPSQREFIELLARVAGVAPRFASIPRAKIHAAGGQVAGKHLYFGEFLDLPPYSANVEKAIRMLGVKITPMEEAFGAGFDWYRRQPRRPVDYAFEDRLLAL